MLNGRPAMLLLLVVLMTRAAAATVSSELAIRGVAPQDLKRYQVDELLCGEPRSRVPRSRLNDEFCDCVETGVDEPGTSACSNGRFYCANSGFRGSFIPSSFVGDGICDCCDGSDELGNSIECINMCKDMAEKELFVKRIAVARIKAGLLEKKKLEEKAVDVVKLKQNRLAELNRLIVEQNETVVKLEAIKVEMEASEAEERRIKEETKRKEEEDRKMKEEVEKKAKEAAELQNREPVNNPGSDSPTASSPTMVGNVNEKPTEESFPYPKEYAFQDETIGANGAERDESVTKEEFPYPKEYAFNAEEEVISENVDEHEDDSQHDDGLDKLASKPHAEPVDSEAVKESSFKESFTPSSLFEASNIFSFLNKPFEWIGIHSVRKGLTANEARSKYNAANAELKKFQDEKRNIEKALELLTGDKLGWLSLFHSCFDKTFKQYTYQVCLFGEAAQKESSRSTSLGTFAQWSEKENGVMLHEGGIRCWNGPSRSAKIRLICQSSTEVISVDEPSTCQYEFELGTPMVCSQAEIDHLQLEIDSAFQVDAVTQEANPKDEL